MKNTKKDNSYLKQVFNQPKVKPFYREQDTLVAAIFNTDEYEDKIEEVKEKEVTLKIHNFIYFGEVTHRIKIANKYYYRVEIKVEDKIYVRYSTTNQLKVVDNSKLEAVKEGVLVLP